MYTLYMNYTITPSHSQIRMAIANSSCEDVEYLLRSPQKHDLQPTVTTGITRDKGVSQPTAGIKRFAGKVAIVTECTEGIGFSIAERLGFEGASVVVSSKQGNLTAAVEKLKADNIVTRGFACDISNSQQVKDLIDSTFKEYGKIDVIVSNIAFLDKPVDINLKYATTFLKEAEGKLRFGSSFVFIAATKPNAPEVLRAMIRQIKPIANEMFSKDIRVNFVASISELDIPADKMREEEKANITRNAVAAAIWLASDAAAGITGTGVTLMVAGEIPSNL